MTLIPFDCSAESGPPMAWWTLDGKWTDCGPTHLRGLLSGAFNPLHEGHLHLQAVAASLLKGPVAFELAALNADKPPLSETEILRRCRQFAGRPVAVSTAATFVEKSRLFPGVTFVVGADTALRVVETRFYGGSVRAIDEALREIATRRCSFLVAARQYRQRLLTLDHLELPPAHAGMFLAIPTQLFRMDVSSSDLRGRSQVESSSQS